MSDPIAVVTGASKGIGRGIAYEMARLGFDVAVNFGRDRPGAEETVRQILARGQRGIAVQADVGSSREVDRMFERVVAELGTPNVLVNNAGVQTWKPLLDLEEKDWDRTIRTNLKGTFLCTQRAARLMSSKGSGRIVNIGSGCNKGPFPKLVDYTASKGGVELFTRVAAVELGPLGITVNCVAPGSIEIERTKLEAPDYAEKWAPITPVRRIGKVEDVAAVVGFLVSDRAGFVNGQTVYADGGLYTQFPWPYD
jgi:NAD(P)-dependent dehydrogenase (short-subunit alcohol dehydrogenase family)